jgi:DNA-binding NtrC family response regulator
VIAATNRVLEREVAEGRFRADLFYRLNAVELTIPPLRDRLEDVPLLAQSFIERCARNLGRPVPAMTRDAEERLLTWPWPGNVRELRNTLERACMLVRGEHINASDLRLGSVPALIPASESQVRRIRDLERDEIDRALAETRGNKKEAAKRLGLSRRALYRRLDKFGLHTSR